MEQTEGEKFCEPFLAPIVGDSPVGIDVKALGVYGTIEGLILAGNWEKVKSTCADLLLNKTKDVMVATFFAQSLAKLAGLDGIKHGLLVIKGLHERYWSDMYPRREGDNPPPTWIWLDRLDRFLQQIVLLETPLTILFEGKSYGLYEWQNCEHVLRETATALRSNKLKDKERKDTQKDKENAELAKAQREEAIAATKRQFYKDRLDKLSGSQEGKGCLQTVTELAELIGEKFESDPDIDVKEYPPPNFECLRSALTDYTTIASGILEDKPQPQEVESALDESSEGKSDNEQIVPMVLPGSREEAIRQLKKIASFFQVTEPHSPIGYLILRAVRWTDMSLDDWLDEVIKEPTALGKIRETLGIQPKPKADEASNKR